jgi:hypothetical protein
VEIPSCAMPRTLAQFHVNCRQTAVELPTCAMPRTLAQFRDFLSASHA